MSILDVEIANFVGIDATAAVSNAFFIQRLLLGEKLNRFICSRNSRLVFFEHRLRGCANEVQTKRANV